MDKKIKICGLTLNSDLSEIQKLRPDYCGFIFYAESPRFFTSDHIPLSDPEIKKVGVFVNAALDEILSRCTLFSLDYVQLHGDENADLCLRIKEKGVGVIKAFRIAKNTDFKKCREYEGACDMFLFDSASPAYGGSGKTFSWEILSDYDMEVPYFLSGGIGPENIEKAMCIIDPRLYGLDLNSLWEVSPGVKNHHLLKSHLSKFKNV